MITYAIYLLIIITKLYNHKNNPKITVFPKIVIQRFLNRLKTKKF